MKCVAYAKNVVSGDIVAGILTVKACERFLQDISECSEYYFDEKELNKVIRFIGMFKHYTGRHSGKAFELEPWQEFVVTNIVAVKKKSTGKRKYSFSYIQVARKQGKSFMASALCLYFLMADNEDAAEVILAANSSDQAKLIFDMCVILTGQIDRNNEYFRLNKQKSILHFDINHSQLKVISNNEKALDGFNASFGVCDEYHIAPTSNIRDVIRSSMGMREQPHLMTVTTAGFNKNLPCYKLRESCVDILNGVKTDETMFALICELDEKDDWTDPAVWIKANPNLDVTVNGEWLKSQVNQAITTPGDEVGIRTKNLNQWVDVAKVWISERYIADSFISEMPDISDEICYIGIDLASVSDLTAVAFLALKGDVFYIDVKYYLPQETVEKSQVYKGWANKGLLTVTPGNVTDYDYILNDMVKASETLMIHSACYDTYNATQFAISAAESGINMQAYSQSLGSFNRPTKEFERLMLGGKVKFTRNEITAFCFRNVILKSDWNGNVKPVKTIDANKIDGVIASLMAMAGYLLNPSSNIEI